jgi:hypothetical protein
MEDNNKLERETKEAVSINEKEKLAYLAGLIDGEGTITLLPTYPDRGIYATYLIVSNSNENLINWLIKNFGGVVKEVNQKNSKLHSTKKCFNWILRTKKAAELIEKCYPYLIVKKPQAEVILEYRKTVWNHRETTVEDINRRRELVEKIRKLNTDKEYKIQRVEKKTIITKCPFCETENERDKGKKIYTIICKNCGKTYKTNYLGKVVPENALS